MTFPKRPVLALRIMGSMLYNGRSPGLAFALAHIALIRTAALMLIKGNTRFERVAQPATLRRAKPAHPIPSGAGPAPGFTTPCGIRPAIWQGVV